LAREQPDITMSGQESSPAPGPKVFGFKVQLGVVQADPNAADRRLPWKDILEKGLTAHLAGRFDEAERLYRLVLEKDPREPNALTNLGAICLQRGQAERGIALMQTSLEIKPNQAHALSNLGNALTTLGRFEEALEACERAVALQPENQDAFNNLGNALSELGRGDEAVAAYDRAITLKPDFAVVFDNKGKLLRRLGRFEESLAAFSQYLALQDSAEAHANRGFMLRELGRFDEALAAYDRAVALDPRFLEALNNRGVVLNELRRLEESLAAFDQALAVDPAYADAAWNKALVLLLHERYAEGWPLFEWRWRRAEQLAHNMPFMPADWLKQAEVAGKTVRLRAEQGLGDTLQMLRYAPILADMGARVTVAVQAPLGEIARSVRGVSEVIVEGEALPACDLRCMMMSLPFVFGTTVDTIPAEVPYVRTSAAARDAWAGRLGPRTRPRIGLAWSGSRIHPNDQNRSLPLETLLPLLDADADFVSLQVEHREADEALLRADGRIRRFDGEIRSFMDTAALIEQMDLVIAVDTSVAHMAGALGRPVWLMLARTPDYRWHLGREDSPWYPSARLFRQPAFGDWDGVAREIGKALTALLFTA
jgi:tetratricopeptide (TPR) repeat protein